MRRFQFRLETVLGWRRLQVETEEARLRTLFEELRRVEAARDRVEKERADAEREVLYAASTSANELAALDACRAFAGRELERLAAERKRCEELIAGQRQRLVEAERRLRLLEKLRDKRRAEWRQAADREQEAIAGELFLGQWSARRTLDRKTRRPPDTGSSSRAIS